MSQERAAHTDQLISEGVTPEVRETTVTERIDGDGIRRKYIDLGTANFGGDYHDIPLQKSPMGESPIRSGFRAWRRRSPRV